MGHRICLLLADGFEEVEALTPADYLARAGVDVVTVSTGRERVVKGSHGIRVSADMTAASAPAAPDWDGLILPGGMPGAANLAACAEVLALLRRAAEVSALICAICAAPALVLAPAGILDDRAWTCYPGMEKNAGGAAKNWRAERVVVDGNVITSRAAGTAGEWSLKIIGKLLGEEAAAGVARAVLLA
ncbi:MAG: DJ-1/PfpI family protein [Spirochaetaceae bacterium]|jgi:4-methyl-5(b-hydroxyethyl)-thiazole monophosphate biosynthesis|nr:DJ-1/PfpI family protein [Spirochaetaceae bacterium]